MSSNALAMVPIRDPNHPKFGNRPSYAFLDAPSIEPHPLPAGFVWPPPPESSPPPSSPPPAAPSAPAVPAAAGAPTPPQIDGIPVGWTRAWTASCLYSFPFRLSPSAFSAVTYFPGQCSACPCESLTQHLPLLHRPRSPGPLYFQPVLSTGCSVLPSFCVPILPRGCKLPSTSPHPVLSTSSTQPLYMVIGPELPIAWRLISGIPPLGIASSPDRVTTLDGSAIAVATQIVSSLNTFTSLPIMTPSCGHPWRFCALS